MREICRAHGVLFVADEVICGYGRVGDWFACSRAGIDPDAVTFAKGITSGYVPLGGVIVGKTIQEPFWSPAAAGVWRHGYTYSGHASAAAAAHANLDIIEREGLLARGLELETEIPEALAPLLDHELVTEIRGGHGAVAAVQIDPALLADDPGLTDRVTLQVARPRRAHAHARRRRPPDLAAARDHPRGARRGRVRPAWRARRRRCCALAAGTASRGSRGRDPSGRSCGTPR